VQQHVRAGAGAPAMHLRPHERRYAPLGVVALGEKRG
jgi:hypothetical protein